MLPRSSNGIEPKLGMTILSANGPDKNKVMNWSSYRARISLSLEENNKKGQVEWNKKDLVKNNKPRKLLFFSGTYGRPNQVVVATKLLFSCAQITHQITH